MRRRPLRTLIPVTMLVFAGLTAACSDDEQPTNLPEPTDLSGTYELVTLTQAGTPTIGPPIATGTLVLTQTSYVIDLTTPDQTGTPVNTVDNGTYSTDGNTWTQESSTTGLQGVGTFTLQGNTLTVNVTTVGIEVLTVWNKTG
ncbi:MAG: hypothetical protein V3T20_07795 [Gemmatimonadota bacterium]